MPTPLAEIAADFREAAPADRLQLLLEFSDELPDLPGRFADAPEKLEQVHECQSPLFLAVEVGAEPAVPLASSCSGRTCSVSGRTWRSKRSGSRVCAGPMPTPRSQPCDQANQAALAASSRMTRRPIMRRPRSPARAAR